MYSTTVSCFHKERRLEGKPPYREISYLNNIGLLGKQPDLHRILAGRGHDPALHINIDT